MDGFKCLAWFPVWLVAGTLMSAERPLVVMSRDHAASCLVKVGELLPAANLRDPAGREHALDDLVSRQPLTVVVLWSGGQPMAREQFQWLDRELIEPWKADRVAVVAIHVGNPALAGDLLTTHGAKLTSLVDPDSRYFSQVATSKLPRTYLVDAQRKVLWLDLEYSRGMRYDLDVALRYFLEKPAAPPPTRR